MKRMLRKHIRAESLLLDPWINRGGLRLGAVLLIGMAFTLAASPIGAQQAAGRTDQVTRELLVGKTWVLENVGQQQFTFNTDSTVVFVTPLMGQGPTSFTAHWHLVGDTVVVGPAIGDMFGAEGPFPANLTSVVVFKDHEPRLFRLDEGWYYLRQQDPQR